MLVVMHHLPSGINLNHLLPSNGLLNALRCIKLKYMNEVCTQLYLCVHLSHYRGSVLCILSCMVLVFKESYINFRYIPTMFQFYFLQKTPRYIRSTSFTEDKVDRAEKTHGFWGVSSPLSLFSQHLLFHVKNENCCVSVM